MLDIKEIERRLGNGEEVRLECVDKKSFINIDHGLFIIDNALIVDSSLLVVDISAGGSIRIKDCQFLITSDEFKYFKIKEKSYTEKLLDRDSKFTELLSVATKAVNNGDLSSFVVNVADSSDKIGECLYIGANMTYHAIENEIKGLEMKGELEVKEEVKTSEFDVVVDSAFKALKDGVVREIGLNNGILMIQSGQASVRKCISKSDVAQNGACKYLEYIDSFYTETFVIESEDDINKVMSRKGIGFNNKSMTTAKLVNGNEILITRLDSDNSNGVVVYMRDGLYKNYLGIDVLMGATVTQQKGNK